MPRSVKAFSLLKKNDYCCIIQNWIISSSYSSYLPFTVSPAFINCHFIYLHIFLVQLIWLIKKLNTMQNLKSCLTNSHPVFNSCQRYRNHREIIIYAQISSFCFSQPLSSQCRPTVELTLHCWLHLGAGAEAKEEIINVFVSRADVVLFYTRNNTGENTICPQSKTSSS